MPVNEKQYPNFRSPPGFFSTAFKSLRLIALAVFVANFAVYAVASWIQGDPSGWEPWLRLLI